VRFLPASCVIVIGELYEQIMNQVTTVSFVKLIRMGLPQNLWIDANINYDVTFINKRLNPDRINRMLQDGHDCIHAVVSILSRVS